MFTTYFFSVSSFLKKKKIKIDIFYVDKLRQVSDTVNTWSEEKSRVINSNINYIELEPMETDEEIYKEITSSVEINDDIDEELFNAMKVPLIQKIKSTDYTTKDSPNNGINLKSAINFRKSSAASITQHCTESNSPMKRKVIKNISHKLTVEEQFALYLLLNL